jgi:phosphoadenosine phosphosulfate reductase
MVNFYKGKIMVRTIVDWSEVAVWSYILENEIPYCELYDKGWDRLGWK